MPLPRASRSDIGLVVFDVDGTLRGRDDPDCLLAEPALLALDEAGIPWTFATGRPYGSMARATAALFGDRRARLPTVNYNGGLVHVPGDAALTRVATMPPETVARVVAAAAASGRTSVVFSYSVAGGALEEATRLAGSLTLPEGWRGLVDPYDGSARHAADVVSVVVPMGRFPDARDVEAFQGELGDAASVSTSGSECLEISPPNVSKGKSLPFLAACFGCDAQQVMAVGDGLNDLDMLSAAGIGVAVANAAIPAKRASDFVARGEAATGVGEAVAWLLEGRCAVRRAGP